MRRVAATPSEVAQLGAVAWAARSRLRCFKAVHHRVCWFREERLRDVTRASINITSRLASVIQTES